MKRLATMLMITALVLQGGAGIAQKIDEAKMDRDLRVASGVLNSLLNTNDSDRHMYYGGGTEANYIEGFGVVFKVADNNIFRTGYRVDYERAKVAQKEAKNAVREVERVNRDTERAVRDAKRAEERELERKRDHDHDVDVNVAANPVVVVPPPSFPTTIVIDEAMIEGYAKSYEEANEEMNKNLKIAFENFLVDYSQLIGQLKPTDKIMLTTENNKSDFFFVSNNNGNGSAQYTWDNSNEKQSRLSAEMVVKDHREFLKGSLSRDKLVAKIKFLENAKMERKPDLDLFGKMLKTVYDANYTETYFISSTPGYEFLTGLGAVYSVRVYSSYSEEGLYRMPGGNKSGLSKEDRNKAVEEMYAPFLENFKENMVRYGSTIKSLESTDKLIVKVRMTQCDNCSIPKNVEFTVDFAVLEQFYKGSLSLDQAKAKVKVK